MNRKENSRNGHVSFVLTLSSLSNHIILPTKTKKKTKSSSHKILCRVFLHTKHRIRNNILYVPSWEGKRKKSNKNEKFMRMNSEIMEYWMWAERRREWQNGIPLCNMQPHKRPNRVETLIYIFPMWWNKIRLLHNFHPIADVPMGCVEPQANQMIASSDDCTLFLTFTHIQICNSS